MRNIKLLIEYDGSRYDGWQRLGQESNPRTIQGKIEQVLCRMTGEDIKITGSGRTDAGVHAYGQVANFHTCTDMSCDQIHKYMNRYLPEDIGIIAVSDVDHRFHSRLNAVSKKYLYRIITDDMPCVFERKYVYRCPCSLNIEAMRQAASLLEGRHDFKAFSSVKRTKKSTVREIYSIDIYSCEREIRMMFHGNGFLYNMVRIMAGTLIEVGMGKRSPGEITDILEGRNREYAGMTAEPQGLFLYEVEYEQNTDCRR